MSLNVQKSYNRAQIIHITQLWQSQMSQYWPWSYTHADTHSIHMICTPLDLSSLRDSIWYDSATVLTSWCWMICLNISILLNLSSLDKSKVFCNRSHASARLMLLLFKHLMVHNELILNSLNLKCRKCQITVIAFQTLIHLPIHVHHYVIISEQRMKLFISSCLGMCGWFVKTPLLLEFQLQSCQEKQNVV